MIMKKFMQHPDPEPKLPSKSDTKPKKIIPDPQHCSGSSEIIPRYDVTGEVVPYPDRYLLSQAFRGSPPKDAKNNLIL
jgi:hypothetical protein